VRKAELSKKAELAKPKKKAKVEKKAEKQNLSQKIKTEKGVKELLEKNGLKKEELVKMLVPLEYRDRTDLKYSSFYKEGNSFGIHIEGGKKETYFLVDRKYNFSKKTVFHNQISIPKQEQGQGIGKKILKDSFALYEKKGINKIKLEAADEVGTYLWAKLGFKPYGKNKEEPLKKYKQSLKKVFNIDKVKSLQELANLTIPKEEFFALFGKKKRLTNPCTYRKNLKTIEKTEKALKDRKLLKGENVQIGKFFMIGGNPFEGELNLNSKNGKVFKDYVGS